MTNMVANDKLHLLSHILLVVAAEIFLFLVTLLLYFFVNRGY